MTRRVTHVRYLGEHDHQYGNENCLIEIFKDGFKIQRTDGNWSDLLTCEEYKTLEVWQRDLSEVGHEWELIYEDIDAVLKEAEDLLEEVGPWFRLVDGGTYETRDGGTVRLVDSKKRVKAHCLKNLHQYEAVNGAMFYYYDHEELRGKDREFLGHRNTTCDEDLMKRLT